MNENKYGNLLDKVMNKHSDSAAIDSINRFRDCINKEKQKEIDEHNRMERKRTEKELAEQERQERQNAFISSMLDKRQKKVDAEASKRKAEERERLKTEESRKATANLAKIDNIIEQNKERRERERVKAERDSRRKW